jgi:hypothetical protein
MMTDFADIEIGAQAKPFFPPSPSWRWYAGAVAVGIASAMACALALNTVTTPKSVAVAVQDAASETVAVKTDRAQPLPVRTIPIVPTPLVAPPIVVPPPALVAPPKPEPVPPSTLAQIEPTLRVHNPDVCERHGGHREDYQRGSGWRGWRCVFPNKRK